MELSGNIISIAQIFYKYTTYLSKNYFKIFSHFSRKIDNVCKIAKYTFFPQILSFLPISSETYKVGFQGWISDMGIDGPTFVPKSGYFLLIWVKVCPQKLAFVNFLANFTSWLF